MLQNNNNNNNTVETRLVASLKYCKSDYIPDVLIFAIFHESIASQIYKSVKGSNQTYTEILSCEFIKLQNITERVFREIKIMRI